MTKIIQFPTKLSTPIVGKIPGKSDMILIIDELVKMTARNARSQGFLIGTIFSSLMYLITQYLMR